MAAAGIQEALHRAYERQSPDGALNNAARRALRQHASAEALQYQQDNAGNIYISRRGRDSELADLALAFPLDAHNSSGLFISALSVFHQLAHTTDLVCGVTLMGYTSMSEQADGRRLWEKSTAENSGHGGGPQLPALESFAKLPGPDTFSFSAILEVSETDAQELVIEGNPVLTAKAAKAAEGKAKVSTTLKCVRAPHLLVKGPGAEVVMRSTIREYSDYIAGLFGNFD